jgi:hypothetical protein
MRRLMTAFFLAVSLSVASGVLLQAQKPIDPPTTDGVIEDPMCPYYIIWGIPIPSGECFCLLFGTCG